jgi:hypothetical protein
MARLKAKILHNHRQIERLRQRNIRLTARLSEIAGRTPSSVTADERPLGATAPKFDRYRLPQRSLAWLVIGILAIAILAIGGGCIGFAIARVLLR